MALKKTSALRKTFRLTAILGIGLLAGAFLAETSMLSFSLGDVRPFSQRHDGLAGGVNGFLVPASSPAQSLPPMTRRGVAMAHHTGV